jgi:hypothetical protein
MYFGVPYVYLKSFDSAPTRVIRRIEKIPRSIVGQCQSRVRCATGCGLELRSRPGAPVPGENRSPERSENEVGRRAADKKVGREPAFRVNNLAAP